MVATKTENSEIAVLQNQMVEVKATLSEIKDELRMIHTALDDKYTTKDEFKNFKRVAMPMTILITAVITGLVVFFFQNINISKPQQPGTTTTTTTSQSTPSGTPSATATSNASATPANPSASDSQTSGGSINVPLPQTPQL